MIRPLFVTVVGVLNLALAAWLLAVPVCRAADATPMFPAQLLAFSATKEQQAQKLAADLNIKLSPEIRDYFKCASQGDWPGVSDLYMQLKLRSGRLKGEVNDPAVSSPLWQTIIEVQTAYEAFAAGGTKYPLAFGNGIIESIPAGSIYFGGTDSGRGLVTALCPSQAEAKPFYTLTQNALADRRYMDYLRSMYGRRIYIPTAEDVRHAFTQYADDLQQRMKHDVDFPNGPRQLKPGEDVHVVDGRVQVTGEAAVMGINALIVQTLFDHNTNCEFYVEESQPLDWMYPYLLPHGLIFKLNREPLPALTTATLDADHAFWAKRCESMLGDWLKPETSVSNVCDIVDQVYGRKNWLHFTGDTGFVTNDFATQAFSKLRSASGDLYQWRLASGADAGDKARLRAETDYAFRQAFALCPSSPEAVYRYVNFLLGEHRYDDALLITRTARKLDPENGALNSLLSQLQDYRRSTKKSTML
jgi:hypothetical protein